MLKKIKNQGEPITFALNYKRRGGKQVRPLNQVRTGSKTKLLR